MSLENYGARSGFFVPVWTLEFQTVVEDVGKIPDAILEVCPPGYGSYRRNARVSVTGMEIPRPEPGSTTGRCIENRVPGATETRPPL